MQALFDPSNSAAVGAWGLVLGVVGIVLTLIGFVISIVQIRRVKTAAVAARDAVGEVQIRIKRYDAAVDLAEAKASLQNARHYATLDAWPQFVTSYEIASEALQRVALQADPAEIQIVEAIKKAKFRIARLCNSLEKHLEGAGPAPPRSELRKAIRNELAVVQQVEQSNWKGTIS